MSQQAVRDILSRALRDRSFASKLRADAETVLAEFDVTDDEKATIVAGMRASGGGALLDERPRSAGRIV